MCVSHKVVGYGGEVRFYILVSCMSVEEQAAVMHLQCLCFSSFGIISGAHYRISEGHLYCFGSNTEYNK